MTHRCGLIAWLVVACLFTAPLTAVESILTYHSDIEIAQNGEILVAETIRVMVDPEALPDVEVLTT